jgi:DNA-binding NtrC family response regulator
MTPPARILVVDDEPGLLDVLQEHLVNCRYHVETALNGEAALAAIARAHPDVVLLDLHMPGMDGLEVLRRIRTLARVIMVTANTDVPAARETPKSGTFDYVTKPIDFDHLDRVIEAALAWGAPPTDDPSERRHDRRALLDSLARPDFDLRSGLFIPCVITEIRQSVSSRASRGRKDSRYGGRRRSSGGLRIPSVSTTKEKAG